MNGNKNGDLIRLGRLEVRYLLDGSGSGGLGVFELTVPAGSNVPPPHSHRDNEEFFFVLEGSIRYTVDGESRELGPGEGMSTPRGSVHGFANAGARDARALVVIAPDIGPGYFRDVAAVLDAGGPPDPARLLEVMARHGLALPPSPSRPALPATPA